MSAATTGWTVDERDALPADGNRYELIDGLLIVTPAPGWHHQTVAGRLHIRLATACAAPLQVLFAPFDVQLGDDTVLEPDLLVAPETAFTDKNLPTAPLLAVEILSPSTKLYDLNLKKASYEAAGVQAYWVIDPTTGWFKAWRLTDGELRVVAEIQPRDDFSTDFPFAVTLTPHDRKAVR